MDVGYILHPYSSAIYIWWISAFTCAFRRPSIGRIFGIQTLNYGCCLIPLSYSVSFTAIAPLRAMSSLSSLSLSASFNRAYTLVHHVVLRISSLHRCSTVHVRTKSSIHVGPSLSSRIHAVIYLISVIQLILLRSSCRCLHTSSLSSSTSTSRITASKPHRSSAPREGVLS